MEADDPRSIRRRARREKQLRAADAKLTDAERAAKRERINRDNWDYIWHLAGVVGIDPCHRTLRELHLMYIGRQRAEWNRAGKLIEIAAAAGGVKTAGGRQYKAEDAMPDGLFDPPDSLSEAAKTAMIKQIFGGKSRRKK